MDGALHERHAVAPTSPACLVSSLATERVWVVMPARDEADRIGRALAHVPGTVGGVVVVDDGSRDATVVNARASSIRPRLVVVAHARSRGVGAAIETGYRRAFAEGAEAVVVMAGDGQMSGDDLERLLDALRAGADYAKGNRLRHPEVRERMGLARYVGNRVLSAATRVVASTSLGDSQCGYTALTRRGHALLGHAPLWPSYGYPNDVLVRLARAGAQVTDVDVEPVYVGKIGGMGAHHALVVVPFVLARAALRRPRRT